MPTTAGAGSDDADDSERVLALLTSLALYAAPFLMIWILVHTGGDGDRDGDGARYVAAGVLGAVGGVIGTAALLPQVTQDQRMVGVMVVPFAVLFGVPLGALAGVGLAWAASRRR